MKPWRGESLCKNISNLIINGDELKRDITTDNSFANKMVVNLYVFCAPVKNRIGSKSQGIGVVTPNNRSGSKI